MKHTDFDLKIKSLSPERFNELSESNFIAKWMKRGLTSLTIVEYCVDAHLYYKDEDMKQNLLCTEERYFTYRTEVDRLINQGFSGKEYNSFLRGLRSRIDSLPNTPRVNNSEELLDRILFHIEHLNFHLESEFCLNDLLSESTTKDQEPIRRTKKTRRKAATSRGRKEPANHDS